MVLMRHTYKRVITRSNPITESTKIAINQLQTAPLYFGQIFYHPSIKIIQDGKESASEISFIF